MTTWSNASKFTTTFTNAARAVSAFITKTFLLREEGGHILLESGGRIIITDDANSNRQGTNYTNQVKY